MCIRSVTWPQTAWQICLHFSWWTEISDHYLTHPFKFFAQPEAFRVSKIGRKQLVGDVACSFVRSGLFIPSLCTIRIKCKMEMISKRGTNKHSAQTLAGRWTWHFKTEPKPEQVAAPFVTFKTNQQETFRGSTSHTNCCLRRSRTEVTSLFCGIQGAFNNRDYGRHGIKMLFHSKTHEWGRPATVLSLRSSMKRRTPAGRKALGLQCYSIFHLLHERLTQIFWWNRDKRFIFKLELDRLVTKY